MGQVCQYHIIQFQPYAETGELANIGVVLFAPRARRLLFKLLEPSQQTRITQFFQTLEPRLLTNILHTLQTELTHLAEYPDAADIEELTRPREDIIRYTLKRVLFADTEGLRLTLDKLFVRYVCANSANASHTLPTSDIRKFS
jgi:hypothetical protein